MCVCKIHLPLTLLGGGIKIKIQEDITLKDQCLFSPSRILSIRNNQMAQLRFFHKNYPNIIFNVEN